MDRLIKGMRRWWWVLPILMLVVLLTWPTDMLGRPGGGHSYSGGSSSSGGGSSSSGGSGDGGDALGLIILLIEYPQIGIPLVVIIILIRIYGTRRAAPAETISTRSSTETMIWNRRKVDNALWDFRESIDPDFSQTLFLDFAQHIYYQYHHHRTHAEIVNLQPYFDPEIIQNAMPRQDFRIDVSELTIGSVDFVNLNIAPNKTHISVRFDANYTETIAGHSNRWWVQETWFFARNAGLTSPAPETIQAAGCPNCGSALAVDATGACQSCKVVVSPGEKTWTVEGINIGHREVQRGAVVGTYAEEQGTNLPTLFDPRLSNMGRLFIERHKLDNITAYALTFKEKIVEPIFKTIYEAWTARDYAAVRPLMSDNLFQSHRYWVEAYKQHKLINRLDDLVVTGVHLVKLDLDKYYEAATVRIFASVRDYTTDESGKHHSGNPRTVRRFSEYWTLVRRTGVDKDELSYNPANCPNCGAPVNMGMTGICAYCNSKVTTGEFGWVLSRITQDEAYYG
jgi:predicted lipid-binding transport protein (Tim44 family)